MLNETTHTKPFKFFLSVSRGQFKLLVPNIIFYCIGDIAILASAYFLGRAVDNMTLHQGGNTANLLILVVVLIICYEGGYRLGHICEVQLFARVRANVKKMLFDHSASLSFGYFADQFAGEIAHKISVTADALERLIYINTNFFIESTVVLVAAAGVLSFISPFYGVFLALWGLLFLLGSLLLAKESNRRASAYALEQARTTGTLVDIYGNIAAVKVYGQGEHISGAHEQIDREKLAYLSLGRWDILTFNYRGIFIIILTVGLILLTAWLYRQGHISLGQIVFISGAALQLFGIIWETGKEIAEFIRHRGEAIQNLQDLITAPTVVDGGRMMKRKARKVSVEYQGVSFGYNTQRVLDKFSLTVNAGDKIGIVGLSGAGKTTFVNLLLRFFDPQQGQILLNGADIRDLTQESLRSQISHIGQETSLFHATIAQNIAYGSPAASLNDINKAARLAYADEFIDTLPRTYDSVVGERGIKLSGGQRQRIAIARAILANRPLFLLDEATSALDSDSEAKIQKGLAALMENKTVIAIAHRLSTLSHMDRIIYLEKGKIAEDGTHEQLLARNGKYAKLWRMQAGGFLPG